MTDDISEWNDWPPEKLNAERKFREARGRSAADTAPAMAIEEQIEIAGYGALRCVPETCLSDVPHVFCHGGGWVFGSSVQSLGLIRRIAHQAKRPVVSIDYPLAPEHPYPAAIKAVRSSLAALASVKGIAGVIAGSAGAQIALRAVVGEDTPLVRGAVLFCGAFATQTDGWSHDAFGSSGGRLTTKSMKRFLNAYAMPEQEPSLDFTRSPPLFLSVGDSDPLLADTLELYSEIAQRRAGDRLEVVPDVSHGFMNEWHRNPRVNDAVKNSIEWLETLSRKASKIEP